MKRYIMLLILGIVSGKLMAQTADSLKKTTATDSLFNALNVDNKKEPVTIFEASRLILSQSTETVKKKNLNVIIIHRFGDLAGSAGGGKTFLGLDAVADVYIGFEYGLTNNLNIDIGRSTLTAPGGMTDLHLKYAMLLQTSDDNSPLAITLIGGTATRLYGLYDKFSDRISLFGQALFARKFSHSLSLQVAPSFVHNNLPLPNLPGNEESFLSLSAAAQLKVSKLMSLVVDYAHPFSSFQHLHGFSDPLGFGLQVVTGGHVFTLNITNARATTEVNYLSNTTSDFSRGQYRIGFTIARIFDFNHKESYKPKK